LPRSLSSRRAEEDRGGSGNRVAQPLCGSVGQAALSDRAEFEADACEAVPSLTPADKPTSAMQPTAPQATSAHHPRRSHAILRVGLMSTYRNAFLLAIIVLTITGFCIRGMHRSTPLSDQTHNMAPASPGTIEVGSVDEQPCWRAGLSRNIGIAELSCDVWERQIGGGGTPQ
jgi:hypothetical protein